LTTSLLLSLETRGNGDTSRNRQIAELLVAWTVWHDVTPDESTNVIHTIFEGTSEIQQLVISRAISGLRIE
jgi:alkylation response protein AidB-like acyl-CoA dehydrogenase